MPELMGEQGALSQHQLLTPEECEGVRAVVFALRQHWTKRSDNGFFTLGTASYLDAPPGLSAYLRAAAASNAALSAPFSALFELVRVFFEALLEAPVNYHPHFALPGFHVYQLDGANRCGDDAARRAHFDLQWQQLFADRTRSGTLSFTLPVELPTGGASMEVWHTTYADVLRLGMSAKGYAARYPSRVVPYVPGRAVVHDGLLLHAIGRAASDTPKGHRITLQGHGVETPEGWQLYW